MDVIQSRIGELAYLGEVTVPERRFGVMEFKSKIVVRLEYLPDTPNQVVKGRSKIVDHISDGESNRWGRLLMNTHHIGEAGILPFTFHTSHHLTWFGCKEGVDQFFQAVNASTYPVKPQRGKMYVVTPRVGHEYTSIPHIAYTVKVKLLRLIIANLVAVIYESPFPVSNKG